MTVAPQDILALKLYGKRFAELSDDERRAVRADPLWVPMMYGTGQKTRIPHEEIEDLRKERDK